MKLKYSNGFGYPTTITTTTRAFLGPAALPQVTTLTGNLRDKLAGKSWFCPGDSRWSVIVVVERTIFRFFCFLGCPRKALQGNNLFYLR